MCFDASKQNSPPSYTTQLSPADELGFKVWGSDLAKRNPQFSDWNDPSSDYDYRAAYLENKGLSLKSGESINVGDNQVHLSDVGKRPTHPTFSIESKYAKGSDLQYAGMWPITGSGPNGAVLDSDFIAPTKKYRKSK